MKVELNKKQEYAFFSEANEILYGGAAGGGKSFYLRVSAIRWAMEIPGCQIYLFRRTYADLRDNHLNGPTSFHVLLNDFINSNQVTYQKSENQFVWTNGSRIALRHCQHEEDVYNYQGAEIHVLLIDELTHFNDFIYRFLRSRVRQAGLNIPERYKGLIPRIELSSNPGNIGHLFVKNAFIKEPFKIYETEAKDGGFKRQFIPATYQDNPSLMLQDPLYEARLDGLGSDALVKAMKYGDWDIVAGQYFDKFSKDIHVLPSDFIIEPHWDRFFAYDHGYNHPFSFGAYAIDEDGIIYKYLELFDRGKDIHQIANIIKTNCPEALKHSIFAGHDCWSIGRDGGKSIADHFAEHGIYVTKANIDRIQGAAVIRELLSHNETRKPKFYIKKNCWVTIMQLSSMQVDPKRPEDVLKVNASENDMYSGDDSYDETRMALRTWADASKPEKDAKYKNLDARSKVFWQNHDREQKKQETLHLKQFMY